jgi:hypothetical protein
MARPDTHTPYSRTGLRQSRTILRPGHDAAVRQETLKFAREAMEKAGFDFGRFDQLQRQNQADMREALAKLRAASDERAPAMWDTVARSTELWLKSKKVGDTLSFSPDVFALSTADTISVAPGFEFLSENIGPWANSAQVALHRTRDDDDDGFDGLVTFRFSFENQTGAGNLFRVSALLGVTASCVVTADGYVFWPWVPESRMQVWADLGITEIVDGGQVIIPPLQAGQFQLIADVDVTGDFGGVGTIAGQDLFRTFILEYDGLYVPANGKVEFDVSCEVFWARLYGGGCDFVATGSGRQVTAPGVFVSTQPWIIT